MILRLKVDLPFELINYLFGNEETKTTSILVKSLFFLGFIIDLKEVVLIFFLDAQPSVFDRTLEVPVSIYFDDVNEMFDFAILSVLDGIGLETVKHLQYSLLVRVHHQSIIVGEVLKTQCNSFLGCLKFLHIDNFLNRLGYVELRLMFLELTSLEKSRIQCFLDSELHKVS